ncbi:hypothetical protein Dsin_024655 [Dipteronia sinensis]|uniref:Uncharacterized protein n=1 Tax=Dipteronia sinensis TaxID=43782 RepID=A0AAD9ZUE3_9ROSI|nr:hypothetical protein Dsin_024655 [Dipteronia sinensis]
MSASSSRSGIKPDDENSVIGQSIENYETNWKDKDLDNWLLPNIQQQSIYKKNKTLDFKTLLGQKTKEINVKFQDNTFSTNLLNKNSLKHYHIIGYNDMHIGRVQVGIKHLAKIGLNNSLLICLRDKRIIDYSESILGIAESSLTYGQIYFQCYPNFTIALNTDEHKEKYLVIDIQTHNYKFLKGSSPYKLVYRIHYRVLTSRLIPSFILLTIPAGQTICFSASPSVNVMVPTLVRWENVNFLEEPHMRNLQECITHKDGSLRISFRERSFSSRESTTSDDDSQTASNSLSSKLSRLNLKSQIPDQYRPSSSEISTPIGLIPRQRRLPILTIIETREIPTHITNVYKTPEQVAQPIHTYDSEEQTSSTPSQVLTEILEPEPQIRMINVIDYQGTIDYNYLI